MHRYVMGCGKEHDIATRQQGHVRLFEREVIDTAQVGVELIHPTPRLGTGGDRDHLDICMRRQKPQQLDPGVTRAAHNTCPDHSPSQDHNTTSA